VAITESRKFLTLPPPELAASSPVLRPNAALTADSRPDLLRVPDAPVRAPVSTPDLDDDERTGDPRPRKLLPWQEKERKIKARRERKDRTGVFAARKRRRLWLTRAAGALLTVVAAGIFLAGLPLRSAPKTAPKRVVDIATSPLGAVSAKVKFTGKITEVHADYNTMLVRAKDGTLASVRFADSVASFAPGNPVEIDGTIREIRAGGICVLDGTTARQL
jgi:hypothetical protein